MKREKILLHSCCAPCSSAVIERLIDRFDVVVFYYNPNIYPEEEYLKRKAEQIRYIEILSKKYGKDRISFLDCDYEAEKFYSAVKGLEAEREGGARCLVCFRLRLEKTARTARENGFDLFSTTLTVSPHKNSSIILGIGRELEKSEGIKFLDENFKKQDGYKRSIELSKENNLYRQNYCGCIFALKQMQNDTNK